MRRVSYRVKHRRKQPESAPAPPDGRSERWNSHRTRRRAELVEAAMRALARLGPEIGMDDVAREAGVTKPVLYRHFTDKADLFVALGERGTEILFERLIPAINREEAPVPRIRKALDAVFTTFEENTNLYWALVNRSFGGRTVDVNVIDQDKHAIATALTALLGDYMRAFNLDSGAAEPWSYGLVGMVQNTVEWWLERRSMSRDSVVEYLTQIIWASIEGIARANGVTIDPSKPLELNKVVRLKETDAGKTQAS